MSQQAKEVVYDPRDEAWFVRIWSTEGNRRYGPYPWRWIADLVYVFVN